jgi:hypothetical protein
MIIQPHRALALFLFVGWPLAAPAESDPANALPALIEQLLEVDSPQTFYAGTFRFTEFPPLDEGALTTTPLPKDSAPADAAFRAMVRLTELGPAALPLLLHHLDDKRETKTRVAEKHTKSIGPAAFVDFRPGDPREESAITKAGLPRSNPGPDFDELIDRYTLTVGDMCFTLIGMITNRSYYIVVDEFDAQLNSATQSGKIVTAVRGRLGTYPRRIELYQQLKNDLEQGKPRFANGAARRLLYYFPGLADNLLVAHLGKLMAAHQPGNDDLTKFLEAIAWSSDPRVMSTLRRFLLTATDASQLSAAAAVYAKSSDPRGHAQLVQLADRLKLRRGPDHVKASRVILALCLKNYPDRKEDTMRRFLQDAGAYACASACLVCEDLEDAPVAALAPLLKIKSKSTGDKYLIKGEGADKWPESDDSLPYRICDRAYETISRLLGDHDTLATGTHDEMDAKAEKLGQRLGNQPENWHFRPSEITDRQKAQNKHRALK